VAKRRGGSSSPPRTRPFSDQPQSVAAVPVVGATIRAMLSIAVVVSLLIFIVTTATPGQSGQVVATSLVLVVAMTLLAVGSVAQRLLAFLAGLIAYGVLFYQQEVFPGMWGYQRLAFLLLPDQLMAAWCGGEIGQVQLLDRAAPVSVAIALWSVAGMLGWLVLELLGLRCVLTRLEVAALGVGIGLGGISLSTLLIGLAGGLRQPLWFVLLSVLVGLAVVWRWRNPGCARRRTPLTQRSGTLVDQGEQQPMIRCWWWAAVPFGIVMLAGAVLPPLDFDVLEYHLQVPKEWYLQGRVTFLAHNVYGNMPLASEMLAAQAMSLMPKEPSWWWGALGGKLALAGYSLLTALLLYAAGRRFHTPRVGAVAALLYISTPWVANISLNGLNESAIGYYLLASCFAGKMWWDRRGDRARGQWSMLALTGLLAGAAVACKYTSLLLVVAPLLVVVVLGSGGYRLRAVSLYLTAVIVLSGPWFVKNWALTGNPTYPLLVSVFGGETRTPEKARQWHAAHQVPRDVQGNRYSPRQAAAAFQEILGGTAWHNPLVVPFLALLVTRGRRNRDIVYWAALLAFVLLAWWLVTHRLTRFWVPAVPLMALLAGVGAMWTETLVWRRAIRVVLSVGLIANFVYITAPGLGDNRLLVSLEQLRDDLRLAYGAHRPVAFDYLARHVPPGSRVLVVGDAAVFGLRVPAIYNTCFDDCRFEAMFRGRSEQERRERLKQLNVSHLYIDWAELRRYRQPGNYGYSPYVTPQLVHQELVDQQQLLRPVEVPGLEPLLAEIFEVN